MFGIIDGKQARKIDKATIESGVSSDLLIERAAYAVFDAFKDLKCRKEKVLLFAGTGNNGADAERLYKIFCINNISSKFIKVDKKGKSDVYNIEDYDVIVDGLLGTGINRNVEGVFLQCIKDINLARKKSAFVIAIDIPSGISSDDGRILGCAVKADLTVTFEYCKYGHFLYPGKSYCGRIEYHDIGLLHRKIVKGLGLTADFFTNQDIALLLPKRFGNSNKGSYGHLLIVAGCRQMPGAAILAAKAAYRSGSGHVTVMSDESVLNTLALAVPEAVHMNFADISDEGQGGAVKMADIYDDYDSILIGPGLGKGKDARAKLDAVLDCARMKKKNTCFIIDADAINILAEKLDELHVFTIEERLAWLNDILPERTVLTPHRKELSRLLAISMNRLEEGNKWLADIITKKSRLVFVLKEGSTMVASKEMLYVNVSGNNGMSTAGSGDVLAGMICSLCSGSGNRKALFYKTCLAVYIHGLAGDLVKEKYSVYGLMAGDLPDAAAEVINSI